MGTPARKPVDSVPERRSTGLPSWLVSQGYTPVPRGFFRELGGRLDYGAFLCLGIVLEESVGKPRSPGAPAPEISEPITEEQFARWTGLTVRGIRHSLDDLDRLGLLRREKRGRGYSYGIIPERLWSLPERPPRKLHREPKPASATAQPLPVILACPLGSECPVNEVYDGPDGLTNVRLTGEQEANNTGTRVPVSTDDQPAMVGERKTKDTGTRVPVSAPPNGDLRAMLERTLAAKLRSLPDQAILGVIAKALGDAPIRELEAAIELKRDKVKSWPFVPLLAKDCRVAWERLGRPPSFDALLDELVAATGDAALAVARKILAHPACAAQQRHQLVRMFPGLQWEAHNGGPYAHPSRGP